MFDSLLAFVASDVERDVLRALFLSHGGARTYGPTVDSLERYSANPWSRAIMETRLLCARASRTVTPAARTPAVRDAGTTQDMPADAGAERRPDPPNAASAR